MSKYSIKPLAPKKETKSTLISSTHFYNYLLANTTIFVVLNNIYALKMQRLCRMSFKAKNTKMSEKKT